MLTQLPDWQHSYFLSSSKTKVSIATFVVTFTAVTDAATIVSVIKYQPKSNKL